MYYGISGEGEFNQEPPEYGQAWDVNEEVVNDK